VHVLAITVTAPSVLAGVPADARTNRVVPDIGDRDRELALVFDRLGLERSLEEVSAARMAVVEVADVRAEQALHAIAEVRARSDHHQMKVVPHQAVRPQVPPIRVDDALEQNEEYLPVGVVAEDDHSAVPARKCMVRAIDRVAALLESHDLLSPAAAEIRPVPERQGLTDLGFGVRLRVG